MTNPLVKRLVLGSVLGTSASMLLMVAGVVYPHPLLLVLVMSIGQGLGLLSLAVFLLAVTLDLQAFAGSRAYDYLPQGDELDHGTESGQLVPPSGLRPDA